MVHATVGVASRYCGAVSGSDGGASVSALVPGSDPSRLVLLARGPHATVYQGVQRSVGREVAIKVGHRPFEDDADERRFLHEARVAARMSSHPHVVDVFDAGVTAHRRPYLVMELCDGSYADRMNDAPISPAETLDVGMKIADALADAHGLDLAHRNVKPSNILCSMFNEPVLSDFDLPMPAEAIDSWAGHEVPNPGYAPPEAFREPVTSPAADVYSLAATLYAMLRGRPPRWRNPRLSGSRVVALKPVPYLPGVPTELIDVLRIGMAADPVRRPTAAQLRDLLGEVRLSSRRATGRLAGRRAGGLEHQDPFRAILGGMAYLFDFDGALTRARATVTADDQMASAWSATVGGLEAMLGAAQATPTGHAPANDVAPDRPRAPGRVGVGERTGEYDARIAERVTGATAAQLTEWAEAGLVAPTVRGRSGTIGYTFQDLVVLTVIRRLTETGLPVASIRGLVDHLRERPERDLVALTLVTDGTTIYPCRSVRRLRELLDSGAGLVAISVGAAVDEVGAALAATEASGPPGRTDGGPADDGSMNA